ncbi:MAG: hypothetical protein ACHREM_02485 [Polyangiales bacterium]
MDIRFPRWYPKQGFVNAVNGDATTSPYPPASCVGARARAGRRQEQATTRKCSYEYGGGCLIWSMEHAWTLSTPFSRARAVSGTTEWLIDAGPDYLCGDASAARVVSTESYSPPQAQPGIEYAKISVELKFTPVADGANAMSACAPYNLNKVYVGGHLLNWGNEKLAVPPVQAVVPMYTASRAGKRIKVVEELVPFIGDRAPDKTLFDAR